MKILTKYVIRPCNWNLNGLMVVQIMWNNSYLIQFMVNFVKNERAIIVRSIFPYSIIDYRKQFVKTDVNTEKVWMNKTTMYSNITNVYTLVKKYLHINFFLWNKLRHCKVCSQSSFDAHFIDKPLLTVCYSVWTTRRINWQCSPCSTFRMFTTSIRSKYIMTPPLSYKTSRFEG